MSNESGISTGTNLNNDEIRSFGYGSDDSVGNLLQRARESQLSRDEEKSLWLEVLSTMSERIRLLERRIKQMESCVSSQEDLNAVLLNNSRNTLAILMDLKNNNDVVVKKRRTKPESPSY